MLARFRRPIWRWMLLLVLGLSLSLSLAQPTQAFEIKKTDHIAADEVIADDLIIASDTTLTVDGTVEGNLIASSETVTVNGLVEGDLIISGRIVQINGVVHGNVIAAGSRVEINGTVSGTVFAAGAVIQLGPKAEIARNAFVAGFSFETEPGATIGRDAAISGYQGILQGSISRNLYANLNALELSGAVGQNVQLNIGEPGEEPAAVSNSPWFPVETVIPSGVRVATTAEIGGEFSYTSAVEQTDTIQAKPAGGVTFTQEVNKIPEDEVAAGPREFFSSLVFSAIGQILTLLLLGAITLWRAPQGLPLATDQARTKPFPALGWGVLTFFGGYISAGFAFLALIFASILVGLISFGVFGDVFSGLSFSLWGFSVAAFTLIVFFGSKLVIAWWVGQALWPRLAPNQAQKPLGALAVGIVVYVILTSIPILGNLLDLIGGLIGLGAIWLAFQAWRNSRKSSVTPPAPTVLPEAPPAAS